MWNVKMALFKKYLNSACQITYDVKGRVVLITFLKYAALKGAGPERLGKGRAEVVLSGANKASQATHGSLG